MRRNVNTFCKPVQISNKSQFQLQVLTHLEECHNIDAFVVLHEIRRREGKMETGNCLWRIGLIRDFIICLIPGKYLTLII